MPPGEWQCQAGGDSCDLSADCNVSISADIITLSRVKSHWQALQLSRARTMQDWWPRLMRRVMTRASVHSSLLQCSPLAPSATQHLSEQPLSGSDPVNINKNRQSLSLGVSDVSRTFYHFHFPIFCRTSHLSSVAAVASLNRRLQCISGDKKRIVNK